MDYTVDALVKHIQKPFLYVDFNEYFEGGTYLLSQSDVKKDLFGAETALYPGLEIVGYCEDSDSSGQRDDLIVEGICIPNKTGRLPHVKWLLKVVGENSYYTSDRLRDLDAE